MTWALGDEAHLSTMSTLRYLALSVHLSQISHSTLVENGRREVKFRQITLIVLFLRRIAQPYPYLACQPLPNAPSIPPRHTVDT